MEENEKSIEEEISEMSDSDLYELTKDDASAPSEGHTGGDTGDSETGYIHDDVSKERDAAFGEVHVDTRSDEEIAEEDKKLRAQSYKLAANIGNFGMFLIIALVICYVIGNWMDGFFDTKPVFTAIWICCGIAASILELAKNIKKAQQLGEK